MAGILTNEDAMTTVFPARTFGGIRYRRFTAAVLALGVSYGILLAAGAIPDDAFITYRTAFNLADHGVYSFNPDEHYPGATSIAYAYIVAVLRIMFGDGAILASRVLDAAGCVTGAFFIAQACSADETESQRFADRTLWLWLLIGLSPPLLQAGASGMETALVILLASLALRELAFRRFGVLYYFAIFMLPLARIDAIAFSLILTGGALMLRRRAGVMSGLAAVLGVGAFAVANFLATGVLLPGSIEAKLVAFHPSQDFAAIARHLRAVLFGDESYLSILAKAIPDFFYAAAGGLFLAISQFEGWRAARRSFVWQGLRSRFERPADAARLVLAASAVLVPLAYAYGGVLFPWYLLPSSTFAYTALFDVLADAADPATPFARQASLVRRMTGAAAFFMAVVLLVASAAVDINVGYQDRVYCAGVGMRLRSLAAPGDTLFLEPAGYIPFYSGLKTFDEVGLASPAVIAFRKRDPTGWWGDFLRGHRPTFVLEHADKIAAGKDYWGHPIPKPDLAWFARHYRRVEEFHYAGMKRTAPVMIRWLVEHGSREDYVLFRRNG